MICHPDRSLALPEGGSNMICHLDRSLTFQKGRSSGVERPAVCVAPACLTLVSLGNRKPSRFSNMLIVKTQLPGCENRGAPQISHNPALIRAVDHRQASNVESQ